LTLKVETGDDDTQDGEDQSERDKMSAELYALRVRTKYIQVMYALRVHTKYILLGEHP
jgi:hypothetical protein